MSDINNKSTLDRLLDDLDLAAWKEDLDARTRRADICLNSSVGLSCERQVALLHEGRAWNRVVDHVVKRWGSK